jgi:hypothetical protein
MANYKKTTDTGTKLYWAATAFMLITAMPVGIAMIVFKLFETKKQGRPQAAPDTPVGARTTAGIGAQARKAVQEILAPLQKKANHRIRFGTALTVFFGFCAALSLGSLRQGPEVFLSEVWPTLCSAGVSGAYLLSGTGLRKKLRRYRTYLPLISSRPAVPLQMLAAAVNTSPGKVRRDLEEMLDTGMLAQGYLDYHSDRLVLSPGAAEQEARKPQEQEKKRPADDADKENALLNEIRQVNDLVKNEKLSAQIDQIGMITAKILDYEKSHPASAPQLHSFLSYYLPTTLKILRAYGQLEAQEVSGGNITAAMVRIENMMDKVVEGFEKQLDQLFLGETMDITADVAVLERMLAKDGLSGGQPLTLEL